MTFLEPIPVATILTAAAVVGGLTVIAYILKMRRRRFEVPFSMLWQRVLREKETTSLWRHLRRILSLLLMLAVLALLLVAALDPRLGEAAEDARNVVVIVDASASMKATDEGSDGDRPRIEVARKKAIELLDSLGGGDAAMIMRMDGQTTPLSRFDSDIPMLRKVVSGIQATDTPADLRRALTAAGDALRGRKHPMIVLIGDGAYPGDVGDDVVWQPEAAPPADDEDFAAKQLSHIDLTGIDVRFLPVGKSDHNVGIVAFNVRRYLANKMAYEVFIEVQNFGAEPARRKLVLYNGKLAVDVKTLDLKPGERVRQIYPNLSGGSDHRLHAKLEPLPDASDAAQRPDVFALDDEAHALLPARKKQTVLLVTLDNLYLEGAMLVYDNIAVDKLRPEEYERAIGGGGLPAYDAVVFDDYTPDQLPPPPTDLVYFDPKGEHSPFPIVRTLSGPRITEVNDSHPVMRWIVLSDVNFDKASVFGLDRDRGQVALASSVRSPLIAAKREDGRKIVAFGFSLAGTDLMMRVAFPLLFVNILDWFAGDDADLITTYATGHRFQVPMDGTQGLREVSVATAGHTPTRAPLVDGRATFYGNTIGIHTLTAREDGRLVAQIELAANLANPAESAIGPPADGLILGGRTLTAPDAFASSHSRALWLYLVLLVAVLLAVEWVTYNRRVTV